ncbi:unnamed protein product [Linum trigynum]
MYGEQFHPSIIGAAIGVKSGLAKANLGNEAKVLEVVPLSSDSVHYESGLTSKTNIRPDLNKTLMLELLTFLEKHHSPFFIAISPFFLQDENVSLDFVKFKETARPRNDTRGRTYRNSDT